MKRVLLQFSQAPYSAHHTAEQLDAALVAAVFDMDVTLLFRGEGVWCLQSNQTASSTPGRSVEKMLRALPTYDITRVYACRDSVTERHVQVADDIELLDSAAVGALINEHDIVMGS